MVLPTVHLIRHGEGFHDLPPPEVNSKIRDPGLTGHGIQQCEDLQKTFPFHEQIDLLCSSPMRRTIQTTQHAFGTNIDRGQSIIALPFAQEISDAPSDIGSDPAGLKREFPSKVDFGFLTPEWTSKAGIYAFDHVQLLERSRLLRQWLRGRDEQNIVLVSHGKFLHYMTGNVTETAEFTGDWWYNCDFRTFRFVNEDDHDATLMEMPESLGRRNAPAN